MGRTSISPSTNGARRAHSIASSFDLTWIDPVAGDELLGFGERPVPTVGLRCLNVTRVAIERGLQAVSGQHDAGLDHLIVELPDRFDLGRGQGAVPPRTRGSLSPATRIA